MGWHCALAAAENDSDPVLAPACSGSASCSQAPGDWAGSHFSPGLRPGRVRGAGGCVLTPSLFFSIGVGVVGVEVGCWVLGALPCSISRLSQALPSTCTAGHHSCWTDDR